MELRRLFFIFFAGILLSFAPAERIALASEKISYPEFEELVRSSLARVPDLHDLWAWERKTGQHVYVGGGLMRGLLHWVHGQLQTHTPNEIRSLSVPAISDLLIQKGADLDLSGDPSTLKQLSKDLPAYSQNPWDQILPQFRAFSLKSGGSTLEKVYLSPQAIEDPAGGLKDFYEGKLRFHGPVDAKLPSGTLLQRANNNRTIVALRFFRMMNDLPELQVAPETMRLLNEVGKIETSRLAEIARSKAQFKNGSEHYFLQKALRKLFDSTGKDLLRTSEILKSANLLGPLARNGFFIRSKFGENDNGIRLASIDPKAFTAAGFTHDEMSDIAKLSDQREGEAAAWLGTAIPKSALPQTTAAPAPLSDEAKFQVLVQKHRGNDGAILVELKNPGWETNSSATHYFEQKLASGKYDAAFNTLVYLSRWSEQPRREVWAKALEAPPSVRWKLLSLPAPEGICLRAFRSLTRK